MDNQDRDLSPNSESRALSKSEPTSSGHWRPPHWLDGWYPALPVPVDGPTLLAAISAAERVKEPADPKVIAAALGETLMLYGKPDHWDTTAKFYLEALADVPPDLLADALRHVRLTCKFFPKPAEIRKPIEDDLCRRSNVLGTLRAMDWKRRRTKAAEPVRPPTEEEKARVAAMVAEVTQRLKGA